MPHHSLASWHGNADRKLKGRLEDIRKKAGIAKRKNTGYHHPNYDHHSESGPSTNFPVESSEPLGWGEQAPTPHAAVDPEEEDFDIICEFFASGGGDDADDERVWQQLAKFVGHRTSDPDSSDQIFINRNLVGRPNLGPNTMRHIRKPCMHVSNSL